MDEYDAGHRDGQAAAAAYYDRDAEIERLRASLCKERAERERLEKAEESRLRAMSMASIVDEMRLLDGVDNLTEIELLERENKQLHSDKEFYRKIYIDSQRVVGKFETEIKRLRNRNAEIISLKADNEKLRQALQAILIAYDTAPMDYDVQSTIKVVVRRALHRENGDE